MGLVYVQTRLNWEVLTICEMDVSQRVACINTQRSSAFSTLGTVFFFLFIDFEKLHKSGLVTIPHVAGEEVDFCVVQIPALIAALVESVRREG